MDRRVWQECLAIRDAGFEVHVVCPRGESQDTAPFEELEGVSVHRYALKPARGGPAGYFSEYVTATTKIAAKVARLNADRPFRVIHAANPPDLLLLPVWPLKRRGAKLIFDHHDLVPELYLSRFARGEDFLYRMTVRTERMAFRAADVVIATNESYRKVALTRGKTRDEDVFVVRSAPDLARFQRTEPDPALKRGREHLIVYLGTMGPQDGIDHALRALAELRNERRDWHAIFVGGGDVFDDMKRLSEKLELDAEFTGRIPHDQLMTILSSADVCLAPDPKNPLNDVSTMNKIVEYMAMSKPIVSYDLLEARASAGEAAVYATANDERAFAACISDLLDDPELRDRMGAIGRARVDDELSWEHSKRNLIKAYERVLGAPLKPAA
jgi:glycosyltransferase involved in cell wall biosynthesis